MLNRRKSALTNQVWRYLPDTGSHGVTVTSFRKSAVSLFLPGSSPQQSRVYRKCTVSLIVSLWKNWSASARIASPPPKCAATQKEKEPHRKASIRPWSAARRQKTPPCQGACQSNNSFSGGRASRRTFDSFFLCLPKSQDLSPSCN